MNPETTPIAAHNRSHPVLAVSLGDMNGVGPEVVLKALSGDLRHEAGFQLFGPATVLEYYANLMGIPHFWQDVQKNSPDDSSESGDVDGFAVPKPGEVFLYPSSEPEEGIQPGFISAEAGAFAMQAVSAGVLACQSGRADALVTAPISKEAIQKAGYQVPGHTEYLAELTRTRDAGMLLVNDTMRIGLATIHIPVRDIAGHLTTELIDRQLALFFETLRSAFGIPDPHIAVLGLNPHAGDGGVIGDEEQRIIEPAVAKFRERGHQISGPWPADGFFGSGGHKNADMVLAMYHDQGLIPLKLSGFNKGVNVTAGLPVIRTSPDHGTAFTIAGKNQADAGSMREAIALAITMINRKNKAQTGNKSG